MLAKSINKVISYFLTNCFTFLTKFWMLPVRKSCSCGNSTILFQYCFMIDFSGYFSRNHFLEGGLTFQRGALFFSWEEGRGHRFWWRGGFRKNRKMGVRPPCPPLWKTLPRVVSLVTIKFVTLKFQTALHTAFFCYLHTKMCYFLEAVWTNISVIKVQCLHKPWATQNILDFSIKVWRGKYAFPLKAFFVEIITSKFLQELFILNSCCVLYS